MATFFDFFHTFHPFPGKLNRWKSVFWKVSSFCFVGKKRELKKWLNSTSESLWFGSRPRCVFVYVCMSDECVCVYVCGRFFTATRTCIACSGCHRFRAFLCISSLALCPCGSRVPACRMHHRRPFGSWRRFQRMAHRIV